MILKTSGDSIFVMRKRLVGYARVSTGNQRLDAQLDSLKKAGCVEIFGDQAVSGSHQSRPELDRCLAELQSGDVLVVSRLDRLGRSAAHLAVTVESLAKRGIGFRSIEEGLDTTTAAGRLILGIFGSLAQFERDLIRERTSAALQAKIKRGEPLGRPRALRPSQVVAAKKLLSDGGAESHVARLFSVSRATLYRALPQGFRDKA